MNKNDILDLLRASKSGHLSGAELAGKLGVSRTAVWKHIRSLEESGYGIEAVPSKGYRLFAEPDVIRMSGLLRPAGKNAATRPVIYLEETASTNIVAMERAGQGAAEGMVVIAEQQTGGKGRLGRSWSSPKGNLYFSIILRPAVAPQQAPLLTLMGAVAVASALRAFSGTAAGIKWPNDILIHDRKVSGLLTEMSAEADRVRHLVLGIGINCNMNIRLLPEEVRGLATTLAAETGRTVDRTKLLAAVLAELDRWYGAFLADRRSVLSAWRELNVTLGREVSVRGMDGEVRGRAKDIDDEGRLVLVLGDGSARTVAAGDVTIIKGQG